jgi:hypothetical protein
MLQGNPGLHGIVGNGGVPDPAANALFGQHAAVGHPGAGAGAPGGPPPQPGLQPYAAQPSAPPAPMQLNALVPDPRVAIQADIAMLDANINQM